MADKHFEDDDPMELVGVGVPCNEDMAAEAFIDEFIGLGMDDAQLLDLFRNPFYGATHRIFESRGEAFITSLIARVRGQWNQPAAKAKSEVEE